MKLAIIVSQKQSHSAIRHAQTQNNKQGSCFEVTVIFLVFVL